MRDRVALAGRQGYPHHISRTLQVLIIGNVLRGENSKDLTGW
nr:hypothetical protein [Escherichia coli]